MHYIKIVLALAAIMLMLPVSCSKAEAISTNAPEENEDGNKEITVVKLHDQQTFATIPAGNYSGITRISGKTMTENGVTLDRGIYAVVNDKSATDGFYLFTIDINLGTGEIVRASSGPLLTDAKCGANDPEGIVYIKPTSSTSDGTLYIATEGNQNITQYNLDGTLTGQNVSVPDIFKKANSSYGLESLAYNSSTLWTTTESTISSDGNYATSVNGAANVLRLQSFHIEHNAGETSQPSLIITPSKQYAYQTDTPAANEIGNNYAFGVSEMLALDDGKVMLMEREFFVPSFYLGAYVICKIYIIEPQQSTVISNEETGGSFPLGTLISNGTVKPVAKTKLCEFRTDFTPAKECTLANYEGMTLGPVLSNGNKTIILISDSQNGYKGILKDWFKIIEFK